MTLLADINAYLRRHGMKPSVFGRLAVNDPRLVRDLREGRLPRAALTARVRAFMGEQRL
ncbi:hypothetical protein [Sphingomonas beigongshangi]|jgi:hypothetical protein|uniref:hypothetical protein n=1 Tax=Sphingomonas beigongshangi TaxID=2782540 RepID=UPI001AEE4FF4|nr:hypothetical protein [Sphingomonas beigongshangi]